MRFLRPLSMFLAIILVVSLAGCVLDWAGDGANEKYERIVELSEKLDTGSTLSANTSNGAIVAAGTDTQICQVTATITARSFTVEEAKLLAEQTDIRLERTPDGLQTVIDRPKKKKRESISVRYDIQAPRQTALHLQTSNGKITASSFEKDINTKTSNGAITINSITGSIAAHTSNGKITIQQAAARSLDLHSSNGKIVCREISGNTTASTSNGAVDIEYTPDASPATDIHITTSNGSIKIVTPKNYSAKVDAATSNSKIHLGIPVTVQGELGKSIKGTIGDGQANLYLRTSNGSINID